MKAVFKHWIIRFWLIFALPFYAIQAQAGATIKMPGFGELQLEGVPQRIVALEYPFVDALATLGVKPVGVADDNAPERLLPEIRESIGGWQSVGTRAQPSLETIAALKPDLIIADIDRHGAVYAQLQKIAPTLILPSRRASYAETLHSELVISRALGKEQQMQTRLDAHQQTMEKFAAQLPQQAEIQFAVATPKNLYAHAPDSFIGGLIRTLGLSVPAINRSDSDEVRQIGLEQLLAFNPPHLVVGRYNDANLLQQWQKQPLWQLLSAVQNNHVYPVDANIWVRGPGILAAEQMAADLVSLLDRS